MNSKQDIRTLRQRCQNLFLTVTKAKTWKYKFNVEIGRKLWNSFIFRYRSGTRRRCWSISDLISLKFGSRPAFLRTGFSIGALTAVKHTLKQHRRGRDISASGRFQRLRSQWKLVQYNASRYANFQQQTLTASVRKTRLKTRGHEFYVWSMTPLNI